MTLTLVLDNAVLIVALGKTQSFATTTRLCVVPLPGDFN